MVWFNVISVVSGTSRMIDHNLVMRNISQLGSKHGEVSVQKTNSFMPRNGLVRMVFRQIYIVVSSMPILAA